MKNKDRAYSQASLRLWECIPEEELGMQPPRKEGGNGFLVKTDLEGRSLALSNTS